MNEPRETKIVTVDDGNGPVKALRDGAGRLLSREQVQAGRDKQDADLRQVTQLREKLASDDAEAKADVVAQVKGRLAVQLAMLERQKAQLQETLAKLEAGDAKAVAAVVSQAVQQLARRAEGLKQAQTRTDTLLAQLDPVG